MRQKKQAKMYSLVEEWQASNQSKKIFCKAHQLNPTTFHYWIQKYNLSRAEDSTSIQDSSFVTLSVSKPPRKTYQTEESLNVGIELDYPNGVHLRLNGPLSISYLSSLIKLSL